MADGMTVLLAEAIKDALNAWTWLESFTAVRVLKSEQELEDIGTTLQVDVSPFGRISAPAGATGGSLGRGKTVRYYAIDVILQQRLDVDDTDVTDALVTLTDEIAEYFDTGGGKTITVVGAQARVCDSPETFTADSEKLKAGVMACMIRLSCEVIR